MRELNPIRRGIGEVRDCFQGSDTESKTQSMGMSYPCDCRMWKWRGGGEGTFQENEKHFTAWG